VFISKEGVVHEPNPIYHGAAANFLIDTSLSIKPNKTIFVSKDGTTYDPQPAYLGAAANILISFPKETVPTVSPTGQGVSGYPIYQISSIIAAETDPGSDAKNATDGKASTAWEGKNWIQAEINGIGLIRTVALKLNGGPYNFGIRTSLDGVNFETLKLGTLTSGIASNDKFDYFTFPDEVAARYIRIESLNTHLSVTTLELMAVDPQQDQSHTGGGGQVVIGKLIYATTGKSMSDFKHWGRHSTNYASGGSGPSERWNSNAQYLNAMVIYDLEFPQGIKSDDNISTKFRAGSHDDSNGGWLASGITYKEGKAIFGKENPHPKTKHYDATNKGESVGDITNKKVSLCQLVYNDGKGVPTAESYCDPSGQRKNWIFLGSFQDKGQDPKPVYDKIGIRGEKKQQIQIRADEAPNCKPTNIEVYELALPIQKNQ
jgi:hypothetical protein